MKNKKVVLKLILMIPLMLILCCSHHQNRKASCQTGYDNKKVFTDSSLHDGYTYDTLIDKNYLLGRFDPSAHPLFMIIEPKLTTIKTGWLRKDVHEAFKKMHHAARKDGIILRIVSATRNFNAQKVIWEAKWNGTRLVEGVDLTTIKDEVERARKILKFSSMPGTSRHHWGTDIDINSVESEYFTKPKGRKEYQWLLKHASTYGFCQTYTAKDSLRPTGYEEEPWHWSYRPVASELLKQYLETVTASEISGFAGYHTAATLKVIEHYVSGINHRCR